MSGAGDHQHSRLGQSAIRALLRAAGLRPTRQRVALASILFGNGHRHVCAERLYEEAAIQNVSVSLATIYNTLHQFTNAKLLREIAGDRSRAYFDTNTSDHHHFMLEDTNQVFDIPEGELVLKRVPSIRPGYEVSRIDVVVRLRPIP